MRAVRLTALIFGVTYCAAAALVIIIRVGIRTAAGTPIIAGDSIILIAFLAAIALLTTITIHTITENK